VRVAAIDLGTGATRLLVANVENGQVAEVHRETRLTRLGEGVDSRRRLLPGPVARVRNCLADYRRTLERLGAERTLAVATSAVRDAENGEAFLGEVEWSYGFVTRLLSGQEEAELVRRGVASGRLLGGGTLVLDVGGGSTELILDGFHTSVDVGSVRLTERYLAADPPGQAELDQAAAAITRLLPPLAPAAAIGVAGTIATLGALDLGLATLARGAVEGHVATAATVEKLTARLASLTVAERRALPAMEPERAPVIVGGALVVREALRRYGLDGIEVSERDLLDGAALVAADLPEQAEGDAPPGAYTCC
jgi:exopolyphosphatase/guanosine-5'-triphosphate,3'-diphosphate pyrophosphatase